MGLKEDIHLVRDNYQWLGSMFYFGMDIPLRLSTSRLFHPRRDRVELMKILE